MLNAPPRTHIGPVERKEVGLLPVEDRVKQLKLNHMFDIIHKRAPEYMNYQILHTTPNKHFFILGFP